MPAPESDVERSRRLRNLKVLVVEDEESMRTLLSRMLARMNVTTVMEAASGPQGLERVEGHEIDLVICDWNMPEMSGMEFFDRVHSLKPDLPFLMVTGRSDASSIVAAKKAGISAYIVKPISQRELKAKIQHVMHDGA
jgi:two-component system, chemotaxis family, chemotaxis protein CheY